MSIDYTSKREYNIAATLFPGQILATVKSIYS